MLAQNLLEIESKVDDPKSYLWRPSNEELKKNRQNYELLINSFEKNKFVSFIGAGVSNPLGICDWNGLIEKLYDLVKELDFIKEIPSDKSEYPNFVERIYEYLKESGKEKEYYNTIIKNMNPTINSTSLTLIYLAMAIDTHLTTNFDRSIEYAYDFLINLQSFFLIDMKLKKPSLYYLQNLDTSSQNRPKIYYLHGSINEHIYILKKSDYDKFYPSTSNQYNAVYTLENCLKYFYERKKIIFIGFSFEDVYLRNCFIKIANELKREKQEISKFYKQSSQSDKLNLPEIGPHFLIIEEHDKLEENWNLFSQLNIYPIVYEKNKHIFLESLLKYLINEKIREMRFSND